MAEIGYAALVLCFVISVYSAVAFIFGFKRGYPELTGSAERGIWAVGGLATVASLALVYLLLNRDFYVYYVYQYTSTFQSTLYTFSAFWAGQEGSLLLWLWILAVLSIIAVLNRQGWNRAIQSYALTVLALIEAFFSFLLVWSSNPFAPSPKPFTQGIGLNPLLENPAMIIHPPVIFIGYASFSIPFAYAVAALLTGQLGEEWLRKVGRWTLFAWAFLGAGIVIGGWWAYMELGWGGYWAWDPVENSSLIPWLTATAFLHSAVVQERRKIFKNWTVLLILVTFILCLFATFVTRSGLIQSVHAFARSPLGYYFLDFLTLSVGVLSYLVLKRRRELRSPIKLDSLLSREAGFSLANLLFSGGAAVVLLGTIFPTLAQALQGKQVQLGAAFFNRTFGPIAVTIVSLMGICPALTWGNTGSRSLLQRLAFPLGVTVAGIPALLAVGVREAYPLLGFLLCIFVGSSVLAEFYRGAKAAYKQGNPIWKASLLPLLRHRRPYGGYLIHLAVVLIALGVIGSSFYKTEMNISIRPGETVDVGNYTIKYLDSHRESTPVKERFTVSLEVRQGDKTVAHLKPEKNFHWNIEQWVTEVSLHSTLKEDLYVSLIGLAEDGLASLQILISPLVSWIWVGSGLLFVGAMIALWPSGKGG